MKAVPLAEAIKAQSALRSAAGLAPEQFPIPAFIGMISDEIETLRSQGKTDQQIAAIVRDSSNISVTAEDISDHYATPQQRARHHG